MPWDWRDAAREIVSAEVTEQSLPHRSEDERRAIAGAFLGATTWQTVCAALGVRGVV